MEKQNGLFIIGVPRSGTTLLRIMLDSHPNLAVGPESPWIAGSYGNLTSFRDLYYSLTKDSRSPVNISVFLLRIHCFFSQWYEKFFNFTVSTFPASNPVFQLFLGDN